MRRAGNLCDNGIEQYSLHVEYDIPAIGGIPGGKAPMAFVFGTKSNNGASSAATPNCTAMSRPRSSGILR